jgi:hypothetical protein
MFFASGFRSLFLFQINCVHILFLKELEEFADALTKTNENRNINKQAVVSFNYSNKEFKLRLNRYRNKFLFLISNSTFRYSTKKTPL